MKKLIKKIGVYISPFIDLKLLLIYTPIWFLMSGWTYLFIFLGMKYRINWMLIAGSTWAGILWLPFTPEKIITIPLTLFLYTKIFGNKDKKTIFKLERMHEQAKEDLKLIKQKINIIKNKNARKSPYTKLLIIILLLLICSCFIGLN